MRKIGFVFALLIVSTSLIGTIGCSQNRTSEGEAMSSPSSRHCRDPLVESFARRICDYFETNTDRSEVFNLADIPGLEAGELFKKMVSQALQSAGSSEASNMAESSSNVVLSAFDNFEPSDFPMVIGRIYGRTLRKRNLLNEGNVICLSRALAEDIWDCFQKVETKDGDGYIMALINACQVFFERLGINFLDVAPDINQYFIEELSEFIITEAK